MGDPQVIRSRDNALVKGLKRLAQDSGAYRKQGRIWVEGDHLCDAALARGLRPSLAIHGESFWPQGQARYAALAARNVIVADELMRHISGLPSPAPLACVIDLPAAPGLQPDAPTVVLDRVQDAGNVGSILRSAAAFGFVQVAALTGTAGLWSAKVLRAGMGAHFGLRLAEGLALPDLDVLAVPLLAASPHEGDALHRARLPWPCAWLLGHEGQGLAPALLARAGQRLRIAQPGGQESLGVAAAAAICLHASATGAPERRAPATPEQLQ